MADAEPSLPNLPSGLGQHPVLPLDPPSLLLGEAPSVRLSSSPASSPRIVGSPPIRSQSIYPEKGSVMVQGNQLGTDFLDLSSDDDSDWVDENATRDFEEVEGLSNRTSGGTFEGKDEDRRRDKESEYLTVLPPFNQIPAHDSATDELSTPVRRPPSQARQLSVKRYDRAAVVHNRGSPRSSLLSEASSDAMPQPLNVPRTLSQNLDGVELEFGQSNSSQAAHQRTPSEVESIRMNAFLNAHYATLHAIDSQQNSPPGQNFSFPESTRDGGVSEGKQGKHIRLLSPIQTTHEPDRPAHLPSHFIKTPYPFTAKKEFPPPKNKTTSSMGRSNTRTRVQQRHTHTRHSKRL